jgi:opacity protein-like surface antigen
MAAALALCAPAAYGQKWEVGAGGGASLYNTRTIAASTGDVQAKFKPGYAFSGYLGQLGERVGGEIRYTYEGNSMELSGRGKTVTLGGRTQAIHYDVNYYFGNKRAKARFYLLGGGGVKQFTGTGDSSSGQSLMSTAVLTSTSQWKLLVTGGGGVRYALNDKLHLRAEVRVYMTPMPTDVITPTNGTLGGWTFNIVPMVGLSYVW